MKTFIDFLKEEEGASAVEYGILVAAVALAIITMVLGLGTSTGNVFTNASTKLDALPK